MLGGSVEDSAGLGPKSFLNPWVYSPNLEFLKIFRQSNSSLNEKYQTCIRTKLSKHTS